MLSMSSDPSINRQWPDAELQDSSKSYAFSGRIMLASIIILIVVVVFLLILHLYARWYLLRLQLQRRNSRSRRTRSIRIIFYVDNNRPPSTTIGLDASVLKSLPLFVFSSETISDENIPECAVCLSEFEEGETGRVLPKCKHSFHTECIDMWFHSNSTCPLCRAPVEAVETTSLANSNVLEPSSSTLVGSLASQPEQVQKTSLVERTKRINDVRIDVPNRNGLFSETEIPLTSPSQGFRSPGSRLLSRIINMSRKSPAVSPSSGAGPSCVPPVEATELDIESASQESSRPGSVK